MFTNACLNFEKVKMWPTRIYGLSYRSIADHFSQNPVTICRIRNGGGITRDVWNAVRDLRVPTVLVAKKTHLIRNVLMSYSDINNYESGNEVI